MFDRDEVRKSLKRHSSDTVLFAELEKVRKDPGSIKDLIGTRFALDSSGVDMKDLANIPQTTYWDYRGYRRSGRRDPYQDLYSKKRGRLTIAALKYFIDRDEETLKHVLNYAWSICEETNWVVPAHEYLTVDLTSAETAFLMAELVHFIGDDFPWEVRKRIIKEIEEQVFIRYLTEYNGHHWFTWPNNWCGVCNSSIGSAFLYLEKDPERLADAICQVLDGLENFFATAFEEDGGSTEGTSYWQYGLLNFVPFAELLRERTGGEVDLLANPRVKAVASYPLNMVVSPGHYANFADCREKVTFSPGVIARLSEKTGLPDLKDLSDNTPSPHWSIGRLPIILRDILWCRDKPSRMPSITDSYLKSTQVVRFASDSGFILAAKAGHNNEVHNHNDVGNFLIHRNGESYICDPGNGIYTFDYFEPDKRYLNIFCNSYGHSVPSIGGNLQKPDDRKYKGEILEVEMGEKVKAIKMEIAEAYDQENLSSLIRQIFFKETDGFPEVTLEDAFVFTSNPMEVEEAFMTFLDVEVEDGTAKISGEKGELVVSIEHPSESVFSVETLEKECRENSKEEILKRITFKSTPVDGILKTKVRMTYRER